MEPRDTVRLAAIADIHYSKATHESLQPLLSQMAERADILLICGDLTDFGLPEEAQLLAKELAAGPRLPIVAVLGNHDYESGKPDELRAILAETGVKVLD